jgi:hypothetical protein
MRYWALIYRRPKKYVITMYGTGKKGTFLENAKKKGRNFIKRFTSPCTRRTAP